jgi:hypothetical protein
MKLTVLVAGFTIVASGAANSEALAAQRPQILLNNSEYFCSVEEFNSVYLDDRANWNSEVVSTIANLKPISLTLKFSSIEKDATFMAEWQTISDSEPRMSRNNILDVVDEGNGLATILFSGVVGQGIITGSIMQAGVSVPVRMAWTDLGGSFYNDAYFYCRRVG